MVSWMCVLCQIDRYSSVVLRNRLGLKEDINSVIQQNRLRWHGHVLREDEGDWVRCLAYEIEGIRPRGRPKKT